MANCPNGFFCFEQKLFIIVMLLLFFITYLVIETIKITNTLSSNNKTIQKLKKSINKQKNNENANSRITISPEFIPPKRRINVATRGEAPPYSQVGAIHKNETILPLYGKQTYRGSNKWLYYTASDQYNSVKVPVTFNNKNCQDEHGCEEIMDNDTLSVTGYNDTFTASIYDLDKPRYIPYL